MEQSERLTSQATEAFPSKSVADSTAVKSLHSEEMTVPKFYAGKKILLTGATGFMGKVLIEKLLRCCPDVGCIYCLIRPKNKQDIAQRISDLTNWKVNGVMCPYSVYICPTSCLMFVSGIQVCMLVCMPVFVSVELLDHVMCF